MNAQSLFYVLIAIIVIGFLIEKILDFLNAKKFGDKLPKEIADIYDQQEYQKSQAYNKQKYKLSSVSSIFSLMITLAFFFFDGFKWLDDWARGITNNDILVAFLFFGVMGLGSLLFSVPFSYYSTFVVEEKFGFNKTTKKMFFVDRIKGIVLSSIVGAVILGAIIWFYLQVGTNFWLWAWGLMVVLSVFINMFFSSLIVPLFNKQTPLEEGDLKTEINQLAKKLGFKLDSIFVIDGSKRSTKANAYFSGFGPKKRIVLFDTLINSLTTEEVVGVLAHEIGHYKKRHVVFNLLMGIVQMGVMLFLFSLMVNNPLFTKALNIDTPSFHIAMVVFGILFSPISTFIGLFMNTISRKFEYQADAYAKDTFSAQPLISALKKLTKDSLSNLTPHPSYVMFNYSHPPLIDRIRALNK